MSPKYFVSLLKSDLKRIEADSMKVHIVATGGSTVSGVGRPPRGYVPLAVPWLTFILGFVLGSVAMYLTHVR